MSKILIQGEALDLPERFSIPIEETNPVYNDRGSQSLPVTVPATSRNNALLGFAVIPASESVIDKKEVSIIDGSYVRSGVINMVSAGRREGYLFNIGFDNSTAYETWSKKKLRELQGLPVLIPDDEARQDVYDLILEFYLNASPSTTDLAVFPIAVDCQSREVETTSPMFGTIKQTEEYYEILNKLPNEKYREKRVIKRLVNDVVTDITVPKYYGLTPFIWLWKVVELVFSDMGYTILSNPFKEDRELARIVILNDVADACCRNRIDFVDLMPDVSVEEFLNSLWVRFGFTYNLDYDRKTARLAFIKDIIKDTVATDISRLVTDYPRINFETPQYVTLSAAASIEGAAPASDRFEDYMTGFTVDNIIFGNAESGYDQSVADDNISRGYMVFERSTARWSKLNHKGEYIGQPSTSFFNWDPHTEGMEAKDLSSVDEWVPLKWVSDLVETDFAGYLPMFLTSGKYRHTHISQGEQPESKAQEETTPLAYMFAFNNCTESLQGTIGRYFPVSENGEYIKIFDDGEWYTHRLSLLFQFKNGLFARFWKDYDELLRHGARSVEVSAAINRCRLRNIDILSPIRYENSGYLIDKLNYSIQGGKETDVELTLRPLIPFGDYDLEKEQGIPDFDPGNG